MELDSALEYQFVSELTSFAAVFEWADRVVLTPKIRAIPSMTVYGKKYDRQNKKRLNPSDRSG